MNTKKTTKINPWKSIGYMISMAWKHGKIVLFAVLAVSALSVGASLVQLYVAPTILQRVEEYAPLQDLLGTILQGRVFLNLLQNDRRYIELHKACADAQRGYHQYSKQHNLTVLPCHGYHVGNAFPWLYSF